MEPELINEVAQTAEAAKAIVASGFLSDPESVKIFTKGLTMAIGGMIPALSIGLLVAKAMDAIGRNPESAGKVFVPMLLGAAFAEAIAIYSLVVVFTL